MVVLGAGPGGYRAAFMAADLGMKVTLVDAQSNPGGVCLYRGCIPTKALLHLAKVKEEAHKAAAWGMTFEEPKIDREKVKSWKDSVVKQLTGGLGQLVKARKIQYIQGWAELIDSHTMSIKAGGQEGKKAEGKAGGQEGRKAEGKEEEGENKVIKFKHLIVATGASPVRLPFVKEYSDRVMNAEIALDLRSIPERLLVIGGGYIGMESATIYRALGSKVSLVEATPGVMPTMDPELVNLYMRANKGMFEESFFSTLVEQLEEKEDGVKVVMRRIVGGETSENGEKSETGGVFEREYDAVLISVGMRPNSGGIGLERAGVKLDQRGFIKVDLQNRTNVPHIFAIGDVAGGMLLAHKASAEGRVAAEAIAGKKTIFDARAIPAVVYTDPEIAWAGLTEQECKDRGMKVRTAKFPWAASGRAVANGDTTGLTKLVVEEETEIVVGAGIIGKGAGDLISELVLAIEMAARVSDIALTIHPHPTVSETVMEVAELYMGHPVHVVPKKEERGL